MLLMRGIVTKKDFVRSERIVRYMEQRGRLGSIVGNGECLTKTKNITKEGGMAPIVGGALV